MYRHVCKHIYALPRLVVFLAIYLAGSIVHGCMVCGFRDCCFWQPSILVYACLTKQLHDPETDRYISFGDQHELTTQAPQSTMAPRQGPLEPTAWQLLCRVCQPDLA